MPINQADRQRQRQRRGRETDIDTGTGTDTDTDRDRQTTKCTHQIDRSADTPVFIYALCMHGWMDGGWAGWLAGWLVGGWMDGWMDICVKEHACMHALCLCLCRHARRQNISTQAMQCSVVQNVRQCYVLFRTVQL